MKSDFSRSIYDPKKQYSEVLLQQGRVQVDADWNEQQAIGAHRDDQTFTDVIGPSGVPSSKPNSFRVELDLTEQDLTIAPGRIYVNGLLCETEDWSTLQDQPHLPRARRELADVPGLRHPGRYLVYLDVWQRQITALEDSDIRGRALGGPETATRLKTLWQVRMMWVAANVECGRAALPNSKRDGTMMASVVSGATTGPCSLPPQSSYLGLENQLYRIEIHTPGTLGTARFKWSRNNESVVTAILPSTTLGLTFQVESTVKDETQRFARYQWVELLDDRMELIDGHGQLLRIASVDPDQREITVESISPAPSFDPKLHPKLRLWDQTGDKLNDGVPTGPEPIALENGIQVQFQGTYFETGDYWLIPARTAIDNTGGHIEWPPSQFVDASFTRHSYCALALVQFDGTRFQKINGKVPDCRNHFDDLGTLSPVRGR